jgi:hypothetical protein
MGVIESEEAAKRLARVIVSDIEIYNREKFQAGADLSAAIEEGRALFRSRVAPELLPLFTSVLEDRRANRKRDEATARAAAKAAAATAAAALVAPPAMERSGPVAVAPRRPDDVGVGPPAVAPQPAVRPAARIAIEPSEPPLVRPVAGPAPIAASDAVTAALPETPLLAPPPAPSPAAPATVVAVPAVVAAAPVAAAPLAPAPVVAAPVPAPAGAAPAPAAARGGIVDTEDGAARLARVILSDVEIYNAKKIASGADLTYEISEGRALFKKRVSPELLPIFETTLATKGLGQRRRAPSPVPVPKAKPVAAAAPAPAPEVIAPVAPAPMAVALKPVAPAAAPAPAVASRPSISAANAPPASQPRPGLSVPRRPTPAPLTMPMALADLGTGHHHVPPASHAAPSGRPGMAFEPSLPNLPNLPPPVEDQTPTPGMMAGMAIGSTPPPGEPHPTAARAIVSRPPATPPPLPHSGRSTGQAMRTVTPVPPPAPARRERTPSVLDLPITVDSGPHQEAAQPEAAQPDLPPQAVLDALPAAVELPPLPTSGHAHGAHPAPPADLHGPAPLSMAPSGAPPRLPTPVPQAQVAAPVFAPAPAANPAPNPNEQVVSLRKGMSRSRLFLTLIALGGASGAIWYFLVR